MGIKQTVWEAAKWRYMKNHLGYDDEQMEQFKYNPKNKNFLSKAPHLMGKTIIAEVLESHGCNSEHIVGDKFFFDGFHGEFNYLLSVLIHRYFRNKILKTIVGISFLGHSGTDETQAVTIKPHDGLGHQAAQSIGKPERNMGWKIQERE